MSVRLVSAVMKSCLPSRLKSLALVLATYGTDDGTSIRPSIQTIAEDWSHSERRTQVAMADLQALGVLVVVRSRGPSRPTEYRMDLERLALNNFRLIGQDLGRSKKQISTEFSTGRGKKNQGFFEFSTVSTGINRTIAVGGGDATVTRSVMIQKSTSTSTARARGQTPKANAR